MSRAQIVSEIHRPVRRNFRRRKFIQKGLNDTWQIDLVEMIPYAKFNKGNKYLLTVIDIFSKYAYAVPIKNKNANNVLLGMQKVFKRAGTLPKNIQSDQGKEFFNKEFRKLMERKKINHYHTYSEMKASIVERFNRTLKNSMWKQFSFQGNYKWISILPSLIEKYNSTYHHTIKLAPKKVTKANEKYILKNVYMQPKFYQKPKYKIGDYVRISKYKGNFAKGYQPSWSTEIFTIKEVKRTDPITYNLIDYKKTPISGSFYEPELTRVKNPDIFLVEKILKRKGNQVFVKWLGFDKNHNSWINKNDII